MPQLSPTARPWQRAVPIWTARVLNFAGWWMIIGFVLRPLLPKLWRNISTVLELLNLPTMPSLFNAALLLVIAAAVRQRKRISIYLIILIFQLTPFLIAIFICLALVHGEIPEEGRRTLWMAPGGHGLYRDLATGAIGLVTTIILLAARKGFPAKLERGIWWRAALILIGGLATSTVVGYLLSIPFPGRLQNPPERFFWSLFTAFGLGPQDFPVPALHLGNKAVAFAMGTISGIALLVAITVFTRSARKANQFTDVEELHARSLILEFGDNDSLSYFSTRRDKSLVFSDDGRAAISYRVVGGVSLASGDPIGDPGSWTQAMKSWQHEARNYGWTLAAISASANGAHAYAKAGLRSIAIGDEAILETATFHLNSPGLKSVLSAVKRAQRSGYQVQVRRSCDISSDELAALRHDASHWRHGESERGFSMALGRFGDPTDARTVVVVARDQSGATMGLLSFVPWGQRGLSLDLMRRNPEAISGVTEFMVASLMRVAPDLAVQRVSLNFAMFRRVFEAGAMIGASPLQRFSHRTLLIASRWWQLDSLYRSNEKYHPAWRPRLLCIDQGASFSMVAIAAGQAEGFIPAPFAKLTTPDTTSTDSERLEGIEGDAFTQSIHLIEAAAQASQRPVACRRPEQERVRVSRLDELQANGLSSYPVEVPRTTSLAKIRTDFDQLAADQNSEDVVSVTGRILRKRNHGGIAFADIREGLTTLQVMCRVDAVVEPALTNSDSTPLAMWNRLVDLGDIVSVTGTVCTTRSGELSIDVTAWHMAAKSLRPMPDKRNGVSDPELKVRQRHIDLATSTAAMSMVYARSKTVRSIRTSFESREFIEVETPMLQSIHGGANARPFKTHINAYDAELYLRIAPELALKRLCIGGVQRVFELGRNFRNEGADSTHNPEFTSVEAYQAFADYNVMRTLTREIIIESAIAVHGRPAVLRPDGTWWDISGDWPAITVHEAVSRAVGSEVSPDTKSTTLRSIAQRFDVGVKAKDAPGPQPSTGEIVVALYDELVEAKTDGPTFYTDFPIETSPLTRVHRDDPRLSERWDLVAFGAELGTAYSELTDPIDQRQRLTTQSLKAAAGDPEAMEVDEDFLTALEFGMPPTGGLGLGVDRIVMLLMGASIRQTLAFPFVRPAGR